MLPCGGRIPFGSLLAVCLLAVLASCSSERDREPDGHEDEGGSWVAVARTEYDYFVEEAGMGTGPYAFRVTDVYGDQLVDEGIGFVEAGEVPGVGQFPSCEQP